MRMGATHFLTKTLPKVAVEMALSVLAYNLTRVMNIVGNKPLMAADQTGLGFSPASLGKSFLHGQDPQRTSTNVPVARYKREVGNCCVKVPHQQRGIAM